MSEKIGGAKGTELDDDFVALEKVIASKFFQFLNFIYKINLE